MTRPLFDLRLYLVTDRAALGGRELFAVVGQAVAGGARLVQLREKHATTREFVELARGLVALVRPLGAQLVINDRVDVALAVGADGVHLGQEDFPIAPARRLAPDLIIGASTHSAAEARAAERAGASYINIGPLFPTQTKTWSGEFLDLEGLRNIARCVTIPWTVMGGIKPEHVPALIQAGTRTIAVITAITATDNPAQAVRDLLALLRGNDCRP